MTLGLTIVAVVVVVVVGLAVAAVAIGGAQLQNEGYLGPHPPTPDGPAPATQTPEDAR